MEKYAMNNFNRTDNVCEENWVQNLLLQELLFFFWDTPPGFGSLAFSRENVVATVKI
jgi:hypothetical protein